MGQELLNEGLFKKIKAFIRKHFIKHDRKERIKKNLSLHENQLMVDISMIDTNVSDKLRSIGATYLADLANVNAISVKKIVQELKENFGIAESLLHYYEGEKEFEFYDIMVNGIYTISSDYNDFRKILFLYNSCESIFIQCCKKLINSGIMNQDYIDFKSIAKTVSPYYNKIWNIYKKAETERSKETLDNIYNTRLNQGLLEKQVKSLKDDMPIYNDYLEYIQEEDSEIYRDRFIKMLDILSESDVVTDSLIEYYNEMINLTEENLTRDEKFYLKWKEKINKRLSVSGKLTSKEKALVSGLYAASGISFVGGILASLVIPGTILVSSLAFTSGIIAGRTKQAEVDYVKSLDDGKITSIIAFAIKNTDKYKNLYDIVKKFNSLLEQYKNNPNDKLKRDIKEAYKVFKKAFYASNIIHDFRKAYNETVIECRKTGKRYFNIYDVLERMGSSNTGVSIDVGDGMSHRVRLMNDDKHEDELVKEMINSRIAHNNKEFPINELDDAKFNYKYMILDKDRQEILAAVVEVHSHRFNYVLEIARLERPIFSLRENKDIDWNALKAKHIHIISEIKEKYKNNYSIVKNRSEWIQKTTKKD